MGYLILQMLLCLLAAALVGFLLGWWIRGARCRTSMEDLEASWRNRLYGRVAELDAIRKTTGDNEKEIESLRADRSRLRNEQEVAEGKAKDRSAEIVRLKPQLETAEEKAESRSAEIARLKSQLADHSRLRNELETAEGKAESRSAEIARLKSQIAGAAPAAATVVAPDDLTKIEGIGSKISQLLRDAGYLTFISIADATAEALKAVLDAGGARFQLHDPTTWPQQARLAAEERWSALEELQDRLVGGKIT